MIRRPLRLLLVLLIAETLLLGVLCAAWQAQRAADFMTWCVSFRDLTVEQCRTLSTW